MVLVCGKLRYSSEPRAGQLGHEIRPLVRPPVSFVISRNNPHTMPTTTTTTTSSDASGSVTTVTTTVATSEALSGGSKVLGEFHNGHIASVQTYTFPTEAEKTTFVTKTSPIWAQQNATGNTSYGYCADIAPTKALFVCLWESPAAFIECEGLFGELEVVTSMIGKMGCDAYLCGNITPEVKAKADAWDQAPGFSCKTYSGGDTCVMPSVMTGMDAKSCTGVGTCEFNTAAELDEYYNATLHLLPIWMNRLAVMTHTRTSPTTLSFLWVFKSYEDQVAYLGPDQGQPELKVFYDWLPRFKSFGGVMFGNTEDETIKKLMEPWTTWTTAPMLSGSLGGPFHIMLQKGLYETAEGRDAAIKAIAENKWNDGNGSYFGFPTGLTGAYFVHYADSTETNRGIQAAYAAGEATMASLAQLDQCISFMGGNKQAAWISDFAGWQENLPFMTVPDYTQIEYRDTGKFGANSITMVQEIELVDAAGYDTFCAINADKGPRNDPSEYTSAQWKISPTKIMGVITFSDAANWLSASAVYAAHAEKMMGSIKKMVCWVGGNITPEADKDLQQWAQAPWCTINKVTLSGKMGL